MKKIVFLLLLLMVYSDVGASYKDRYNSRPRKVRHRDRVNSDKFEYWGYWGLSGRFIRKTDMVGGEALLSIMPIYRNLQAGFNFGAGQGVAAESYGYNTPGVDKYHLSSSTLGINLDYVLYRGKKMALAFDLLADLEMLQLGDVFLFHHVRDLKNYDPFDGFQTYDYYHTLRTNDYLSLRPTMGIHSSRFCLGLSYNFLATDQMFGQTASSFGKAQDFEGFELYLNVYSIRRHYRHY